MDRKRIILMTDFGPASVFVGIMKGVITQIAPDTEVVDFCHTVNSFSLKEAAFLLYTGYQYFPQSSIFVVVIDPGVGSNRNLLLVETSKYIFLVPDNGIISWVLRNEKVKQIIKISNPKYFLHPISSTFHGRDIFAPVAAYLARGIKSTVLGNPISVYHKIPYPRIYQHKKYWIGEIIYIDKYGNVILNWEESVWKSKLINKRISIWCNRQRIFTGRIYHNYTAVEKNRPFLVWDSFGFLELGLRENNFADHYRLTYAKPKIYLDYN